MRRSVPLGNDADEWRLWLLDRASQGAGYLAVQIAEAFGKRDAESNAKSAWHREGEASDQGTNQTVDSWPRITSRITTKVSPWVDLIAREVEFLPNTERQIYHAIKSSDYVNVLAMTPDGRIPLVRQYRPALESFTLEFPAGLVDRGEDEATTASRELLEETGFPTRIIHPLGINAADSGRLSSRAHSFFIEAEDRVADFVPEAGVIPRLVTPSELVDLILSGEFSVQSHLGTLLQAVLHGHLKL